MEDEGLTEEERVRLGAQQAAMIQMQETQRVMQQQKVKAYMCGFLSKDT